MSRNFAVATFLLSFVTCLPAKADTYVATFSGHVIGISGSALYGAVGDAASISVTYDASTPESNHGFSGNTTFYNFNTPSATWTFQVGTSEGTMTGGGLSLKYSRSCGFFCSSSSDFGGSAGFTFNGFPGAAGFDFVSNPGIDLGTTLSSATDVLATTLPSSAQAKLFFNFNGAGNFETLSANIESYSVTGGVVSVPGPIVGAGLPGLLALFGVGGLYWRRKQLAG